jgi:hypothetical protein
LRCRAATLGLFLLCAGGCEQDVWALVHPADGTTVVDAGPAPDATSDLDAVADAEGDAAHAEDDAGTWAGRVIGSDFDEYAGLVVHARIGSTSSEIVSTTIAADGTFVLHFPAGASSIDEPILYLYIDVTESGQCDDLGDYLADTDGTFPEGFELHITPDDLGHLHSIWGCFRFS